MGLFVTRLGISSGNPDYFSAFTIFGDILGLKGALFAHYVTTWDILGSKGGVLGENVPRKGKKGAPREYFRYVAGDFNEISTTYEFWKIRGRAYFRKLYTWQTNFF